MNTQKEIFIDRLRREISEKGLRAIHVTPNPNRTTNPSEEEFYGELNRMFDAPDQPDPEVLGAYSLLKFPRPEGQGI